MLRDERGRFVGTGQDTSSGSAVADELEDAIAAAAVEVCLEVESNVREATPVRTGHAAASWTDSIGAPVDQDVDSVSAAGARAEQGRAAVLGYRLGMGDLFVGNPVDYIEFLNGGSSNQAPAEFCERSAEQALETVQARHNATETKV